LKILCPGGPLKAAPGTVGAFHTEPMNHITENRAAWGKIGWVKLVILILAGLLVYANTLQAPFILDDGVNIRDNPHIRLTELTWRGIAGAALKSPLSNRPVANASFALNYYLHKYDLRGFHLVNIFIHLATGTLLYFLTRVTLNLPALRSRYGSRDWIPFFTALLWLVHPLQTQSVTYIVQRMNSLSALFYVLALLCYAKSRLAETGTGRWALVAGCGISTLLAFGSKETTATLPLFIFLYEWFFFQDLSGQWLKKHFPLLLGVFLLLALLALAYLGWHPLEKIASGYGHRDFSIGQRVLTQFRVILFYLSLLLFPHPSRLNLDHDFSLSRSLTDPLTTLPSMGLVAALFCLALFLAKRERLLSFCLLWFLGNLFIESSFIGLEMVFEHRTYLPSMFIILMVVVLISRGIPSKWLATVILCAMTVICAVWTFERNSVWRDEVALWRDCALKSPAKPRTHLNLGRALARKGAYGEAITRFSEALRIKPDYAKAYNNLGAALASQKRYKEAIAYYTEALRLKPDYARAHNNLGAALANQKQYGQAVVHFSEALRIQPDYETARKNLALVLQILQKGKTPSQAGPAP